MTQIPLGRSAENCKRNEKGEGRKNGREERERREGTWQGKEGMDRQTVP